jgi:hypothetical protein
MFSQIRNFITVLLLTLTMSSVQAYEVCTLNGDFVPWPWSEQYYNKVLDQNWIIMDKNGQPTSELVIQKTSFFFGLGGDIFTFVEKDTTGKSIRWGMAKENYQSLVENKMKFKVMGVDGEGDLSNFDEYTLTIGYWKSSKAQLTVQEMNSLEESEFKSPFIDTREKVCRAFNERTDSLVGIIIDKADRSNVSGELPDRYFGLTQDPNYVVE